jgi:hypothetical protein
MQRLALLLALVAGIAGCATNHFGRMPPLSDVERGAYTCREIEIEMAKAAAFVNDIVAQSKGVSEQDVLGFLGDFGIGNSIEYQEATASGMQRLASLNQLFTERQCEWTITPVAAPVVPTAPEPPKRSPSGR